MRENNRATTIWAPVVAALGASFLTGALDFGTIWWQQQRRRDRLATFVEKDEAYHQLIAPSLSFTIRARTLRDVMRRRSRASGGN